MSVFEDARRHTRSVAREVLPNGIVVSTIFMPSDVTFNMRDEYETMVFIDGHGPVVYGDHCGDRRGYCSDESAMAMHEEFVAHWRAVPAEQTVSMMVDAVAGCYSRERDEWKRASAMIQEARAERDKALTEVERLRALCAERGIEVQAP